MPCQMDGIGFGTSAAGCCSRCAHDTKCVNAHATIEICDNRENMFKSGSLT